MNNLDELKLILIPANSFFNKINNYEKINSIIQIENVNNFIYYDEKIQELVENKLFCNKIDYNYIYNCLKQADFIIIGYFNNPINIISFCLIEIINSDKFKVSDICTHIDYENKGYGTKLLKIVDKVAKIEKIKKIILNSVKNRKTFYKKRGFNTNNSNSNINKNYINPMSKIIKRRTRKN